jgi:parallel beta-helix repeat protein
MKNKELSVILSLMAVSLLVFGSVSRLVSSENCLHKAILIDGNCRFSSANGVSRGSGTNVDPYVIENLVIDASSSNGIQVKNTTAYFIIRNCIIENGTIFYGIFLDNVTNGKVENNTCRNNYEGIAVYSSSNSIISNNICGDNYFGIAIEKSQNNLFENNTCRNDTNCEIIMHLSPHNNLINNNLGSSERSIDLSKTGNQTVDENFLKTFGYCINGIALYSSPYNNIISNFCQNGFHTGIKLSDSSFENLTGNVCAGNNVGIYLESSSDNRICGNNCSGNSYGMGVASSSSYNILFNNRCESNLFYGIHLNLPSAYNNLTSNICNANEKGICLQSSFNNTLTGNVCKNNLYFGIQLYNSSSNTLSGNVCVNNSQDIFQRASSSNNFTNNIETRYDEPTTPPSVHLVFGFTCLFFIPTVILLVLVFKILWLGRPEGSK